MTAKVKKKPRGAGVLRTAHAAEKVASASHQLELEAELKKGEEHTVQLGRPFIESTNSNKTFVRISH
jgi:hypothetical protein